MKRFFDSEPAPITLDPGAPTQDELTEEARTQVEYCLGEVERLNSLFPVVSSRLVEAQMQISINSFLNEASNLLDNLGSPPGSIS